MKILIGTASWSDPGFIEDWYPKGLAKSRLLAWYAEHFNFVEVNSTFYGLPQSRVVEHWCRETPDDFTFDVKLHKLLSRHGAERNLLPRDLQRKTTTTKSGKIELTPGLEEAVARRFLEEVLPLVESGKLGAFLLQLSPAFRPKHHKLEELSMIIDTFKDHPLAVELRNRDWMSGENKERTVNFFRRHKLILVAVDAPDSDHFTVMPGGEEITNPDMAYLRLHGRDEKAYVTGRTVAERFNYDYSEEELHEIADRIERFAKEAKTIHTVFNNNRSNFAPKAAEKLKEILSQQHPELARPKRLKQESLI